MPAVATAAGLPSRLGKYELLMPLAAGGMARIYIGRSTGIGSFERHVVLKMITPERAHDLTAVNMFLDEARLAASLNHQNVAQVFEVGEDAGIHYLAMEYVHGQDLRAVLAKAGSQGTRIPLELALTVVAGAAAGLHHAHERRGPDGAPLGIVHRDVSPSNIMIGYDGAVKLLDFGIAKAAARSVETQSGIIKGKFAYMSPEQCRGREVDRRSDVFSLGIILYEVTTQHRCFRADSDFDTMHRIVTGDVVRPTRLVQGYPQALEAIVMKALAIDPAQRYQSAGLLLEALESFAVSSRMSLSTMGLGRFMREMFGDVQEPWLNTAATKVLQPIGAKENTISSTNGQGSKSRAAAAPSPAVTASAPDAANAEAAATMLDLPQSTAGPPADATTDWTPDGYPRAPSTRFPAAGAPPTLEPAALPLPPPAETPPLGQFSAAPGSGSAPAILVPTRHGYASGAMTRGDVSYPQVSPDLFGAASDVQITPNRRPYYIGLGIVAVGVIVMLAVSFGGSDEPVAPRVDEPTEAVVAETVEPAPQPPRPADDVVEENMVSVVIHSDPPGADVLIAGTKIGTTPFESKLKRGTKITQLTVQKDGYAPFNGKIDLGGEYENRNIRLVPLEESKDSAPASPGPADPADPADKPSETPEPTEGTTATTPPKPGVAKVQPTPATTTKAATTPKTATTAKAVTTAKTPTKATTPAPKTTTTTPRRDKKDEKKEDKKEEKCQPPGPNVDPFGPPICKV